MNWQDPILYDYAIRLLGAPYIWGGKTPQGFDCSGYVCALLMSCGELPNHTIIGAQEIFDRYQHMGSATLPGVCSFGALVFYGQSQISIDHVEFGLDQYRVAGYRAGDHTTLTPADAAAREAYGGIRPVDYRRDRVAIVKPAYVGIGKLG